MFGAQTPQVVPAVLTMVRGVSALSGQVQPPNPGRGEYDDLDQRIAILEVVTLIGGKFWILTWVHNNSRRMASVKVGFQGTAVPTTMLIQVRKWSLLARVVLDTLHKECLNLSQCRYQLERCCHTYNR